jgi:cytochrome c-type biogenesis protein CcmH
MGWIVLLAMIAVALGLLRAVGTRGAMLQLCGAGLLFGAAGYAVQGHPGLVGSPHSSAERPAPVPLTRFRHAFYGNFTPTEHWLVISESYASRGRTDDAANVLNAAVREHPGDPLLWTGLGNALADHAGVLTPASELVFRRAAALAPNHPGPRFFLGLALARSGDPQGGTALWRSILAEAPANASWRPLVEDAIAAVSPPRAPQTGRSARPRPART